MAKVFGLNEGLNMLKEHCEFNEPTDCYVILAVSRKKDTPDITHSTEIIYRDVIKNKEDIERKYLRMKRGIEDFKDFSGKSFPFYLYVMINPGNARKATLELLNRITGWISREREDLTVTEHYKRVSSEFMSCLANPKCRGSKKYFMIDYDEKPLSKAFISDLENHTEVYFIKETKNGFHIKCKPFDRRLLKGEGNFEIKKDCLLFIEYFKNGSIV